MLSKSKILESEPLCLRATGMGIAEIDILSAQQAQAISLFVSQNSIEHIQNIGQFHELQRLMIAFNKIRYIEDLLPLANVPTLREINLEGNPVCRLPLFVFHILYLLPNLEKLSGKEVNQYRTRRYTREKIAEMIRCEADILRNIALCDVIIDVLRNDPKNSLASISDRFAEVMPESELILFYDKIRRKASNFAPVKYFKYLRELLLYRHKAIQDAAGAKGIDQSILATHQSRLASVAGTEHLAQMTEDFNNLNLITAQMVEIPEETENLATTTRKSRMSMSFGQNERLSSRLRVQKKTPTPSKKSTRSRSRRSRRSSAMSKRTEDELTKSANVENTEIRELVEEEEMNEEGKNANSNEQENVLQIEEEEVYNETGLMNEEEDNGDDNKEVETGEGKEGENEEEIVNGELDNAFEEEEETTIENVDIEAQEGNGAIEEEEEQNETQIDEVQEEEEQNETQIHDVHIEEEDEDETKHQQEEETIGQDDLDEKAGRTDLNAKEDNQSHASHGSSHRGSINYADLAYSAQAKSAFDKLMEKSRSIDIPDMFESRPPPSLATMTMRIKELTERHTLMRKIEHQETLNNAAKQRLSQINSECRYKKITYGFQ